MRLLERRERWGLTWTGRIAVLFVGLVTVAGAAYSIHPFLAVTDWEPAETLVLEGWAPERVYAEVARHMAAGGFARLVIVVHMYEGDEASYDQSLYYDEYLIDIAVAEGIPLERIELVLAPVTARDRTFSSAMVVRRWLETQEQGDSKLVVATVGAHARRSRLLYARAFWPGAIRGVIALADVTYEPTAWWRTSEGIRVVVSEAFAYFYTRLFFREPDAPEGGYVPYRHPERQ